MLSALALIAMAARALVPAGYMLAPPTHGSSIIVLCTSHGLMTMPGMDHSSGKPDHSSSHRDAPCAFAAVAHLAPPEAAPNFVATISFIAEAPLAPFYVTPGRGLAAPPPWSTGPPAVI